MAAALFSVGLVLLAALLFLVSSVLHIRKIQKELEEISLEQVRQNEDIKNLMMAYVQLISDIKEAVEVSRNIEKSGWKKPMGEA
jgi:hypothetical protein